MPSLQDYLPEDRRAALARGETLPERTHGSALFADISGFTALTERLTRQLGARRGIEEFTRRVNLVYDALIRTVEQHAGSMVSFAGDAITCWFDDAAGAAPLRAVGCALSMQAAMQAHPDLLLKVVVTSGEARRWMVGNQQIQLLDTLAGATIARLATAEHLAHGAEVLADAATVEACAGALRISEWRLDGDSQQRFAVIAAGPPTREAISTNVTPDDVPLEALRPWVLRHVYAREQSGLGEFLTELRPAVALFLSFGGIDYDRDADAHTKLDALMRRVQQVVAQHGGTVLQLTIGDKGSYLYACFGAPTAHEDDARRAVRAALTLRDLPRELPYLDSVRIGISGGTVRAGAYGGSTRHTYGVHGDEVNLAARLMTNAAPGEILLSGRVQQSLAEPFTLEPRAPLPVKGKAEPVPVFALTGTQRRRATRLLEPTYRLPMMGRQTELALIGSRLEQARQGHGQVIGITAEAGMGKSRLVAEVIRLAHRQGFAGYGGACESSGTNTSYLCWKAIWQAFFDVDPAAPVRRQLRHLEGEIEDRVPDRLPALPLLAPLLDIQIDDNDFTRTLEAKDRRNALEALLEDCVKTAAHEEPLLFMLEDVHWIDPLSQDLLEALARATANLPVCLVLAYRPPDLERMRDSALRVETLPQFTRIELNELTAADAEQLVRAKLAQLFPERSGALPRRLVEQLATKAEGNPFYLEELLNYLRDRDISPYDERAVSELDLPSSLHTLILSRMDQLTEAQKVTLKVASIIGRLFPFAWLHSYYPALGAPEAVKADLSELARLDLTPLDSPEPELAYLFKHIVTQEVAYESLAYATRAQLHAQLAEYLEAQDATRLDLLAFHYGHSENLTKRREYFRKAGDAAQAAYANTAAIDYYERLLDLLPGSERERTEVLLQLGSVLQLVGQWAAAEERYREALARAEQGGDRRLQAQGEYALARLMRVREHYAEALAMLEHARAGFTAAGDQLRLAEVLAEIANIHFQLAKAQDVDLGPPRALAEESVALARRVEDGRKVLASALGVLAAIAMFQKDVAVQRAAEEESLAIWRELNDRRGIAMALYNLATAAHRRGERQSIRPLLEESLSLFRQIGDKFGADWPLGLLGGLSISQGEYAAARRYFGESSTFLLAQGSRGRLAGVSLRGLGEVAFLEGDFVTAQDRLEHALEIFTEIGDQPMAALVLVYLALTALEQGEPMRAERRLSESLAAVRRLSWSELTVSWLTAAARLAQVRGELVRAVRLSSAVDAHSAKLEGSSWSDHLGHRAHALTVEQLKQRLDAAQFAAAWAEGEALTLDEALALPSSEEPA